MKPTSVTATYALIGCILSWSVANCFGDSIKAFSLREANRQLEKGKADNTELTTLGGITRVVGMVFDRGTGDIVLVGKTRGDMPPASLDDLVVALRSRLLKGKYPKVSIDMVDDTPKTGMQDVRFEGDIGGTKFGQDFLGSDVILKRYSLDLLRRIQGIEPYLSLYESATRKDLLKQGHVVGRVNWLPEKDSKTTVQSYVGKTASEAKTVQSRFWFHVMDDESFIVERDDVYVIEELRLGVEAETVFHQGVDAKGNNIDQGRDEIGQEFAKQFTECFWTGCDEHPLLKRLKVLFDLVCIAEGIAHLGEDRPDLEYLMNRYRVQRVDTPEKYPLVQRIGEFRGDDDVSVLVQLSGGIEMEAILLALEDGDVSALKLAVLESRPEAYSLCWNVPLDDWQMPNNNPPERKQRERESADDEESVHEIGFSLGVQSYVFDPSRPGNASLEFEGFSALPAIPPFDGSLPHLNRRELRPLTDSQPSSSGTTPPWSPGPLPAPIPDSSFPGMIPPWPPRLPPSGFDGNRVPMRPIRLPDAPKPEPYRPPSFPDPLRSQPFQPGDIGGVMLHDAAKISADKQTETDLVAGNFSLVVDGQDSRISAEAFRRFVTVLWCVYYSKQDPGISIDPIAPDVDKHLVRYIGRVVNTDLGRVMREADYRMKKWAVGTERPDIPGFKDVDTWEYYHGNPVLAGRRFWFVPENMRFKRGGDLLLFDGGRMKLNTECDFQGGRGQAAQPDKAFARFFTEHYDEISEKYPVYQELFQYAKLVALAKYLKQHDVPLYWFLMANKDMAVTEDSPGTVDELAKGSDYFHGVSIKGGVNLGVQGNYVYDQDALEAITKAFSRLPAVAEAETSLTEVNSTAPRVTRTVSFDLGEHSYTAVPQHSLNSGKDRRGIRYQTDLALRNNGQPGLELVRYFNSKKRDIGDFGQGWNLLIPYRVQPANDAKREFLNAMIPEQMVVENLLTGDREVLAFSEDRYAAAGYVPDELASSQVIGLFLMSNASYRLADKLGNQFHFDQAGRLTDMFLSPSPEHHAHVEYVDAFTRAFAKAPYVVKPAGDGRIPFLNAMIPKSVTVNDLLHGRSEALTFSDKGQIPGYVPDHENTSRFRVMAILANGGLQLVDRHGNEIRFDPGGRFESMLPAPDRRMVRSISMGGQKATFNYTINHEGQVVIASAALSEAKLAAIPTHVVRYEYDAQGRLNRVCRPEQRVARRGQDHVAGAL
ncbi:MAG: hypothetical protein ISR77_15520 [Pirellulaceae bacterium]|nr:hypothetical protein [Pirellulaceae bacterium]